MHGLRFQQFSFFIIKVEKCEPTTSEQMLCKLCVINKHRILNWTEHDREKTLENFLFFFHARAASRVKSAKIINFTGPTAYDVLRTVFLKRKICSDRSWPDYELTILKTDEYPYD